MVMNNTAIEIIEEEIVVGQTALENGCNEEAANHFLALLQKARLSFNDEALIRCHLSEALQKLGRHSEQLEVLARWSGPAEFSHLPETTQMLFLIRHAWACFHNNELPRAIALFNQGLKINEGLDDDLALASCYSGLGCIYKYISEFSIARDCYMSAITVYRRIGRWRELATAYISMSTINVWEGQLWESLRQLEQAIAIIGDHQDHYLLGEAYCNLSVVYLYCGPTTKLFESLKKFQEQIEFTRNPVQVAKYYDNKAWALIWTGKWNEAEALTISAIELLRETTKVQYFADALHTLAEIHLLHGRMDEAEHWLKEARHSLPKEIKSKHHVDSEIEITFGRCHLIKGQADLAIEHFERAIEMSIRVGSRLFLFEPRLQLIEALIAKGELAKARKNIEDVRPFLRQTLCLRDWGLVMRLVAKLETADGHIMSALQSLNQSTSSFRILSDDYSCAVNQVVRARILEIEGRNDEAISEVEHALAVFERLGAAIDERKAKQYYASIKKSVNSKNAESDCAFVKPSELIAHRRADDQISVVDDFIVSRLVQSSFSQQLLLHELVSIVREKTAARAAIIVEAAEGEALFAVASIGLSEIERDQKIEFLSRIPSQDYACHLVYGFTDNHQSNYLLHIVEPKAELPDAAKINLKPLLSLVEQGLEALLFKSKSRIAQVFDPAKFLARIGLSEFICESGAMKKVLEQIHKIRSSNVTVLITGESGTGKELIARAIHNESERRASEFLPFNCSAAPRDMIESQLFGHRKGAFTGANTDYNGVIRAAEPGTLFLDEIGDLPLELQPKLLRFLQESEIQPLGHSKPVTVDVRVIAATNRHIEEAIASGRFREDLFYRLNVIRISVPPLRERREDISGIISYYLKQYQQEAGKIGIELSEEVVDMLMVYDWPGNIRQLCNELRRLVAYSESETVLSVESLSSEITTATQRALSSFVGLRKPARLQPFVSASSTLPEAASELDRQMIRAAMQHSSGNVTRAAKELGLSRAGLYLKMKRLNYKP